MASASSLAQLQSHAPSRNRDSSSALETVEIDPQFAGALGFSQGDVVEIGLQHDLPVAKSIATEPLTADDWEILVCFEFFRGGMSVLQLIFSLHLLSGAACRVC
jgi:peroxin-1